MTQQDVEWITVDQAAHITSLPRSSLYVNILPHISTAKLGRRTLINYAEFKAYLDSKTTKGTV